MLKNMIIQVNQVIQMQLPLHVLHMCNYLRQKKTCYKLYLCTFKKNPEEKLLLACYYLLVCSSTHPHTYIIVECVVTTLVLQALSGLGLPPDLFVHVCIYSCSDSSHFGICLKSNFCFSVA